MSTRERLIEAGLELFHKHGIHPVALDRILNHAGVTKTTFYNHFDSKEDFTCSVLDRFGEEVRARVRAPVDAASPLEMRRQLLHTLDVWDRLFDDVTFRGCMLLGAGVSSGDENDPARQTAIKNKRELLHCYEHLAQQAGIPDPRLFAARFGALVDAALVAQHLFGDQREASEARRMVEELVEQALPVEVNGGA